LQSRRQKPERNAKPGIVFHEERATNAVKGHNPRTAVWILVLVAIALILLAIYTLRIGGR
jgi:preprotein translocase subunit Sec61beta